MLPTPRLIRCTHATLSLGVQHGATGNRSHLPAFKQKNKLREGYGVNKNTILQDPDAPQDEAFLLMTAKLFIDLLDREWAGLVGAVI